MGGWGIEWRCSRRMQGRGQGERAFMKPLSSQRWQRQVEPALASTHTWDRNEGAGRGGKSTGRLAEAASSWLRAREMLNMRRAGRAGGRLPTKKALPPIRLASAQERSVNPSP